jgi:MoaA/NifB/PqqE/SkfB family radical SAM enzyme
MISDMEYLLAPGQIRQIRIDLTTACNLRCVYCAVSQAGYVGQDMTEADLKSVVKLIRNVAKFNHLDPIDINGHGESTFARNWVDLFHKISAMGLASRITSNFAKEFSEEELDALACMSQIGISIDTSDRSLLRRVRRKVDVRQITMNMQLVRAAALKLNTPPPRFHFLAGLYDKSADTIVDFARFAVAMDVKVVQFWSLTPYARDQTDVALQDWVLPLENLDPAALRSKLLAIRRAIRILERAGVEVIAPGGFLDFLARRVENEGGVVQ